jgi:DNA modification methylase
MVFTDPPYNVNYKGQGEKTKRGIENDHMEENEFTLFLENFFKSAVEVVKEGAGWYVFHSSSTQDQFKDAMREAGLEVRSQLIWNKPTSALGWGDYRWKHEPFYYGGKKGKLVFYGDRTHKTVFDFHASEKELIAWVKREKRLEAAGLSTIWTMKRDPVNEYVHPTQKPVELISYALVNSSKAGDVVLDPFGGSGSLIIACEKTDRIGHSIELDPTFADIIVQRWVDYARSTDVIKNGEKDEWELSPYIENLVEGADDVVDEG